MIEIFADLHIHIGRTHTNKPVKITGSKTLTLDQIVIEASEHKGIDLIGVIDCHVPEILVHLKNGIKSGTYRELSEGGIKFGETTLLLGSEIEIYDEHCYGPIHVLAFLPTIEKMIDFSNWMSSRMKNITLSSQRIYERGKVVQLKVKELGGLFIPAHIFTPFKSLYGKGVKKSLKEVFAAELIDAVELGLSSDTLMASKVSELNHYPFLTNSDAHSLPKIGREYQKLLVKEANFNELHKALLNFGGRRIITNYGLNPLLGKYHETTCENCSTKWPENAKCCPICSSTKKITGVKNRLAELTDQQPNLSNRPPYIHQVPLQFIPGLGPKTLQKLKDVFGTEMNILHKIEFEHLVENIPEKMATKIIAARTGELPLESGGGGIYGRVKK